MATPPTKLRPIEFAESFGQTAGATPSRAVMAHLSG